LSKSKQALTPPQARKIEHVETRHGGDVVDPYFWLRDRSSEEVLRHLKVENAYADAVMEPTRKLRQRLYDEMLGRIKEDDSSVPERIGDYWYYSRTEEGKPYRTHCRKHGDLEAPEQILLDENLLAGGHEYFRLGTFEVSPDHTLLAYAVDGNGSERFTLRVKDLRSGRHLADVIPDVYYSVEWSADGRWLFYTTLDAAHRPYRLVRHELGADPAEDTVVYQEDDEAFFLGLYKTKSKRFLMLSLESNNTSEVHFLAAGQPLGPFRCVQPRQPKLEYSVEHHDESFLIRTNHEAVNFKLVRAPIDAPGRQNWTDVVVHDPGVKLDLIEAFAGHVVLLERRDGVRGARVFELPDWTEHVVRFPEPVHVVYAANNPEFETDQLRIHYTSLITPNSVFDYDMRRRELELKKETDVLGGYDRSAYRTRRVFAEAADGTPVPLSLVYRGDLPRNGRAPLLLYGYGAYGLSVDPAFDSTRLSLLDRGFVYAIAHVRGGGDLGRPWYDDGKLMHKRNSFEDLIACAERLIRDRYTSPERLVVRGGSAGGLLVGAVANMRPDLFRLVVALVPFVDVINTLFDSSLPLEEWGDPRQREPYDYIRSYSPYDNVEPQRYPEMLVTAGLNDPRVAYWEPAKWVARLRELKTDDGIVLFKTEMGAGHAGPSGRYKYLEDLAFEYAFVLDRLGVE